MALCREAEALQRLDIELQDDRLRRGDQPHRRRALEIGLVGVLEIELLGRQLVFPEAAIGDVAVELLRVGCALALRVALGAAPAGERPDARRALVQSDIILVAAGITGRAVRRHESGEAEPRAQLDQHILERPHIAVGRDDRLADRIPRSVGTADRSVEQ